MKVLYYHFMTFGIIVADDRKSRKTIDFIRILLYNKHYSK